uniref:Leucine rich repeat containing 56 n=1 Tax=Nomascus leucogenys TaxID=61853 RepID=G1RA68_NOMLE
MDPGWDRSRGPRPSTSSIRVRELSCMSPGTSIILQPKRGQALARVDDLRLVRALEMCVDTREGSLGNFGVHLPNLDQLKLNGSHLGSLRDLGTALGHLQVLWLARCGLADLDGIASLPALKELYASYNNISDLSPLCLLEQLEVLDLEGNSVEDLGQVRYLQLCPRLAVLTLEGNLVCLQPAPGPTNKVPRGYNYRTEVRKLIPQLQVLDEVPAAHTGPPAPPRLSQDWLAVKEAIKKGNSLPSLDCPRGAAIRRLDPELSLPETQPWASRPWPFSLLVHGGPLPEGLLSEDVAPQDNASSLTHGAGQVLWLGLPWLSHHCPLPYRHLESQQEGAVSPWGLRRVPEEQVHQAEPRTPPSPRSLASGTEPARLPPTGATPQWAADLLCAGAWSRGLGWAGNRAGQASALPYGGGCPWRGQTEGSTAGYLVAVTCRGGGRAGRAARRRGAAVASRQGQDKGMPGLQTPVEAGAGGSEAWDLARGGQPVNRLSGTGHR